MATSSGSGKHCFCHTVSRVWVFCWNFVFADHGTEWSMGKYIDLTSASLYADCSGHAQWSLMQLNWLRMMSSFHVWIFSRTLF
jgi:hypothetical protein